MDKCRTNPTSDNINEYKKCRANARKVIKKNKRKSCHEYVSKLNIKTPAKKVWDDKTCPKWKEEMEIQRIKAERGISYTDAKKQMDIFNSVKTTYAQAAAATKPVVKTVNVETQTEMTWSEGTKQPKSAQLRNR